MSMETMMQLGKRAKKAAAQLSVCTTAQKNKALLSIADALLEKTQSVIEANRIDLAAAKENGISEVMADRLMLNEARIAAIANSVRQVVDLEDPIGIVESGRRLENGLSLLKMRVPLGVVGMIYESRPNVTVDAAVLCLKSSNVAFLRGGKEAIHTNCALAEIMRDAVEKTGMNPDVILLVEDTSRESSAQMMQLTEYLDVLIPRGGAGLIRAVAENAKVPVIETGVGNCHIYVDDSADLEMAVRIVDNAKTSRPSVCNACESLLVHRNVAGEFLPMLQKAFEAHHVVMLGCERTRAILGDQVLPATEEDYATEFLDYRISVKIVDSLEEAISHIMQYTTHHSECIVTNNWMNANAFTEQVDAAAVYVNASTRFTDGGEFGLGAEIGISTQKLHARGPMGLREMTTTKYVIHGNGQIR
jgi:glutamate-5-semialdehyde dehydrogenase